MSVNAMHGKRMRSILTLMLLSSLVLSIIAQASIANLTTVRGYEVDDPTTIAPSKTWGTFFGTSGDVEIDLNRTGIAVRVEIPREFLQGVVSGENDTHFIETNLRNDFYYYSVVDESAHWTYGWKGNETSDGPCFKPRFSLYDANAPWCVEIWNYLNGTFLTFTPPKFIRFHDLTSPSVAGIYNFTVFVADHTNSIGYPDFVHAWNTTLFVPVSMRDAPASISGYICDAQDLPCLPPSKVILGTKGVVYAQDSSGNIVARAFVNQTTGFFNVTGLAPGTYTILGSAGYNNAAHTAYSLSSSPTPVIVGHADHTSMNILLNRAPQVCGRIEYHGLNQLPLAHALSDHPYISSIGLKALNITVEATDAQGHIYRNMTLRTDNSTDSFRIFTGSNVTYIGTDPYGTEFAGLPPTTSGPYQLNLKIYITGYLQAVTETVTVSASPGPGTGIPCNTVNPNPVVMNVGGVIQGTIQFWNSITTETPHEAEASLPVPTVTDALFGGNVLIQAYDHLGILRAVSVLNGTNPDQTTIYKDKTSIPFLLFGFSEYLNHTWSGTWSERDYGLPGDSGYSIQVYIRGYELSTTTSITLGQGANASSVQLKMTRGGAFEVSVFSFNNRVGSRALQALKPFLFLNLSIPVPARIYFYDSSGRTVGWVECILRLGITQPDKECHMGALHGSPESSFIVWFAGQNWSVREIWFYSDIPTHVTNDEYTIKTFTLGYVWQHGPMHSFNTLLGFAQVAVDLLIGDELDITNPVFVALNVLGNITENDHAIGQALLGGSLTGAVPMNITKIKPTDPQIQVPILEFPIFGFGGMAEPNGTLKGQGHFFYVQPDGTRNFDYGLDNATYTAQVPEFGFNRHFTQRFPPEVVTFFDLFLETGVVMSVIKMGQVISDGPVTGWVNANTNFEIAVLSWVQVTASNATYQRTVPTLDGNYVGPGGLNLPQGTYNITFSVAYYKSSDPTATPPYQTQVNLFVQWGSTYPVVPPEGPLCPIDHSQVSGGCDPPASPAPSGPFSLAPSSLASALAVAIPIFSTLVTRSEFDS